MEERELTEKTMVVLRSISRITRNMHMSVEQNFSDWRMLRLIMNHFPDGGMPSQVAKHMGIALPTVSKRLYELEEKGYILRRPSETDRRVTYIYATEQGKAIVEDNYRLFIENFHQATVSLGAEKTQQMYDLLEEFRLCLESQQEKQEASKE